MLNSKKLLYIFSDVAYVAELLPAKKTGDFSLQSFRQINGEYLNNDVFISENIEKLFAKLEKEEYLLVLPDFFFTNTIIEVDEKVKTKIEKHINEELLPSLSLAEKTHQIQHFILTQYGEKSNVQLSAVERSLLAPIYESATTHGVKVAKVASLSWTIKALISLEPSLSLVQMGENLHLVQHYIGVDQAISAPVTDVEKIAETIKTLKGAEPSIQTIYLLTNELVEAKLKDLLKATLPLQQLTEFSEAKSEADKPEVPTYVKQVIEAGAKTLAVPEFNVPLFNVEKVDAELIEQSAVATQVLADKSDQNESGADETEDEPLPEPKQPPVGPVSATKSETALASEKPDSTSVVPPTPSSTTLAKSESDIVESKVPTLAPMPETKSSSTAGPSTSVAAPEKSEMPTLSSESIAHKQLAVPESVQKNATMTESKPVAPVLGKTTKPEPLKNKTGVSSMLRMVFVSIAVFFLTVGIGVGLGISYLTVSQATPSPTPLATILPTSTPTPATPTPSASPAAAINPAEIKLLVVNATSKAGYASTIKKLLAAAKFTDVDTGNAKGDYETGNYILMTEENPALTSLIETATKLEFSYSKEIKTEDLQGSYDAVLVLGE